MQLNIAFINEFKMGDPFKKSIWVDEGTTTNCKFRKHFRDFHIANFHFMAITVKNLIQIAP